MEWGIEFGKGFSGSKRSKTTWRKGNWQKNKRNSCWPAWPLHHVASFHRSFRRLRSSLRRKQVKDSTTRIHSNPRNFNLARAAEPRVSCTRPHDAVRIKWKKGRNIYENAEAKPEDLGFPRFRLVKRSLPLCSSIVFNS